jgi:hypothetical protein
MGGMGGINPFLMGGYPFGGIGGQGAPAGGAPADTRPPRERFAE